MGEVANCNQLPIAGGTVLQWFAVLPHKKKVLGLTPPVCWGLGLIGDYKLPIGVNVKALS